MGFLNLMICFSLHPPFLISLCTLLCSLHCSCLWRWNFRQRRLSLQNTAFTHKAVTAFQKAGLFRRWEMSGLKRTSWSPNGLSQKKQAFKDPHTKSRMRSPMAKGQRSTGKALLMEAQNPRHPAPGPALQNLCLSLRNSQEKNSWTFTDSEKISCKTECTVCCYLNNDGNNSMWVYRYRKTIRRYIPKPLRMTFSLGVELKRTFTFSESNFYNVCYFFYEYVDFTSWKLFLKLKCF